MPSYITEPTTEKWPPTTIPCVMPSFPNYSFGRAAGYVDAPTINTEIAEAMPANGTAGRQFAVRAFAGLNQNSPAITWETTLTGTSGASIKLQGAINDVEAQYFDLDTSTNATGEVRTVALGQSRVNFLRIKVNTSTNTNGTIIAKFIL